MYFDEEQVIAVIDLAHRCHCHRRAREGKLEREDQPHIVDSPAAASCRAIKIVLQNNAFLLSMLRKMKKMNDNYNVILNMNNLKS